MSELTVTEFVKARLDEDEAWAHYEACKPDFELPDEASPSHPARVLAQCAAMRKIMVLARGMLDEADERDHLASLSIYEEGGATQRTDAFAILRDFASIWSDHPQFDPAWA